MAALTKSLPRRRPKLLVFHAVEDDVEVEVEVEGVFLMSAGAAAGLTEGADMDKDEELGGTASPDLVMPAMRKRKRKAKRCASNPARGMKRYGVGGKKEEARWRRFGGRDVRLQQTGLHWMRRHRNQNRGVRGCERNGSS